jgi:diadenosine tetraphosphate (Ap4A) HIT family hydrolase
MSRRGRSAGRLEDRIHGAPLARGFRPGAVRRWLRLGNGVPHLHVHLVPRPLDDPNAGRPVKAEEFEQSRVAPLGDDALRSEAATLREILDT